MTNSLKLTTVAAALAMAVAGGATAQADGGRHSDAMPGALPQGGMMGLSMPQNGGMMGMKTQMSRMMEACSNMMQSAMKSSEQPTQTPTAPNPENQGS